MTTTDSTQRRFKTGADLKDLAIHEKGNSQILSVFESKNIHVSGTSA